MADNNINIPLKGTADFSQVYAQLNALKASIAAVNKESSSLSNVSIDSKQIDNAQKSFINTISAIRGVRVEMVGVSEASAHLNTRLLDNKRSISEMFTTYRQGKNSMIGDIQQIAQYQAKLHQSMVVPSAVRNGQAAVVTNFNEVAKATLVNEMRLKAYNTEMLNLTNSMVNFGKNTQWSGRQLTVGLTVPLLAAGGAISAMFMQVDKSMRQLLSVYGVGGTAHGAFSNILPSAQELQSIQNGVMQLSQELAKMYGQSAATTTAVAADLAAAGYTQQQLLDLTKTVTNAMVLGQTDQQDAVKATIAIQNTYKLNIKQTADALNFFSAAQAATSTNMKDLIDAVPRVGPIMQNLGGTYKDTVAMIVAMKEGGVAAGEGANALKNSLQRIVAPTKAANDQMKAFGINLTDISKSGSPVLMIEKLQVALNKLDPVARQVAITDLFGKFQAARVTALLDNFNRTGTQSAKVMQMMSLSAEELGKIQQNQLNTLQESPSMKFQSAIENLKTQLLPIGQKLIEIATPLVNAISWLVQAFQNIGPIKYLLAGGLGIAAIAGPIIMFVGLISNLGGQLFKIVNQMRMFREGFSAGGGLAKPFNALKEGIKGTQNYLEKFDAAQYASEKAAQTLQSTLDDQRASWIELTSAMEKYRNELESIRNIGSTGPFPPAPGGGGLSGGPGGIPRLPVGGPMAPAGIVGEASRPVHVEALNVNLANQRGKLNIDGGGEVEFSHLRPAQQTMQGSNVLNIPDYDPRRNAQGSFGIVPGYLTSGAGQVVNNQLGAQGLPVIPTSMNSEQTTRQILEQLGVPNITDAMVRKVMQELSIENIGSSEAGKIAQMQALGRLQSNPAAITQFKALGNKEGATGADVEAFFAQKLGAEWEVIKQDAARQILRLYEIAQKETEQAVQEGRVTAPQNIQQQLSLTGARFSELISEQYNQIALSYSEALRGSLTVASTDFANITEQMKRKTMIKLVNAGAATESMMNSLVSAIESLIQQVRNTTNQLTAEAKTATAQVATATARGLAGAPIIPPTSTPRPPVTVVPMPPVRTSPPKPTDSGLAYLATGGKISGPGGPKDDLIPAMLSNGEYVVRADAVGHYGTGFLDSINHKKLAGGGVVRLAEGPKKEDKGRLGLHPIPYETLQWDEKTQTTLPITGVSSVIDFNGRQIVMVDVGGQKVPFYRSTGMGGKKETTTGDWYPFFGIGDSPSGPWINKTTGSEMAAHYGSVELREIAQYLNSHAATFDNMDIPRVKSSGAHIDAINSAFPNPVANNGDPNVMDIVRANIQHIVSSVAGKEWRQGLANGGIARLSKGTKKSKNFNGVEYNPVWGAGQATDMALAGLRGRPDFNVEDLQRIYYTHTGNISSDPHVLLDYFANNPTDFSHSITFRDSNGKPIYARGSGMQMPKSFNQLMATINEMIEVGEPAIQGFGKDISSMFQITSTKPLKPEDKHGYGQFNSIQELQMTDSFLKKFVTTIPNIGMNLKSYRNNASLLPAEDPYNNTQVEANNVTHKKLTKDAENSLGITSRLLSLSEEDQAKHLESLRRGADYANAPGRGGGYKNLSVEDLMSGKKLASGGIARFSGVGGRTGLVAGMQAGAHGGYSRAAIEGLYASVGRTPPAFPESITETQLKEYLMSPASPFYGYDVEQFFATRQAGETGLHPGNIQEGWSPLGIRMSSPEPATVQGSSFTLEVPGVNHAQTKVSGSDIPMSEEEKLVAEAGYKHAHDIKSVWDTMSPEQVDAGAARLRQHLASSGAKHMRLYRSLIMSPENANSAPGHFGLMDAFLDEESKGQRYVSFSKGIRIPKNFANPNMVGGTPRIVEVDVPIEAIVGIDRMNYDSTGGGIDEGFREQEVIVDISKIHGVPIRYITPAGISALGKSYTMPQEGGEIRDPILEGTPVKANSGSKEEAEFLEMLSPKTRQFATETMLDDITNRWMRRAGMGNPSTVSFVEGWKEAHGTNKGYGPPSPEQLALEGKLYGVTADEMAMAQKWLEETYGAPISKLSQAKMPDQRSKELLAMVKMHLGMQASSGHPIIITDKPGNTSSIWSQERITGRTAEKNKNESEYDPVVDYDPNIAAAYMPSSEPSKPAKMPAPFTDSLAANGGLFKKFAGGGTSGGGFHKGRYYKYHPRKFKYSDGGVLEFAQGGNADEGFFKKFAGGSKIYGPGGPKDDLIPAMVSNGEYIVNADAVNHYGSGFMDAINAKKLAGGGDAGDKVGTAAMMISNILPFIGGIGGGNAWSDMLTQAIQMVANQALYMGDGFRLIGDQAKPLSDKFKDFEDRQIVRTQIVMDDLAKNGKTLGAGFKDMWDKLKNKVKGRGKDSIIPDLSNLPMQGPETEKQRNDRLARELTSGKKQPSLEEQQSQIRAALGVEEKTPSVDNRGRMRKGLNKVGGFMRGGGGMMLGSMVSMGASELTGQMEQNAGGATGNSQALNYGAQALGATMMFGPEVFIPATIAATALGYALGKQAEDERNLRTEIDKSHQKMENFRATLGPSGDAVAQLGLHIKTINDIKFTGVTTSTDEFRQKVDHLADAFSNGSEASQRLIQQLKELPKAQQDMALGVQAGGVLQGGGTRQDALATAAAYAKSSNMDQIQTAQYLSYLERKLDNYGGSGQKSLKYAGYDLQMNNGLKLVTPSSSGDFQDLISGKEITSYDPNLGLQNRTNYYNKQLKAQFGLSTMPNSQLFDFSQTRGLQGFQVSQLLGSTGAEQIKQILSRFNDQSTGKDFLQNGDVQTQGLAKLAGVQIADSYDVATQKINIWSQALSTASDSEIKAAQQMQDFQGQIDTKFTEPLGSAIFTLSSGEFKSLLNSTMSSIANSGMGGVAQQKEVFDNILSTFGDIGKQMAPMLDQTTESMKGFLSTLNVLAQGSTAFADQAAMFKAALTMNQLGPTAVDAFQKKSQFDQETTNLRSNLVKGVFTAQTADQIKKSESEKMKTEAKNFRINQQSEQDAFQAQQKAEEANQKAVDKAFSASQKGRDKEIKGIQKEMDARQKLWDAKQKGIEQDKTLRDLQNDIYKARATGSLLDIAAAQSNYNTELKKQQEINAKDTADQKDKDKITAIQDAQAKADEEHQAALDKYNEKRQAEQDVFDAQQKAEQKTFDENQQKHQDAIDKADITAAAQLATAQRYQAQILTDVDTLSTAASSAQYTSYDAFVANNKGTMQQIATDTGQTFEQVQTEVKKDYDYGQELFKTHYKFGLDGTVQYYDTKFTVDDKGNLTASSTGQLQYPKGMPNNPLNNPATDTTGTTGRTRGNGASVAPITSADGGHIRGPGTETSDSIPAMLSDGEYVVRASSVKKYGTGFMDAVNRGHYANGGRISKFATGTPGGVTAAAAAQGNWPYSGGIPNEGAESGPNHWPYIDNNLSTGNVQGTSGMMTMRTSVWPLFASLVKDYNDNIRSIQGSTGTDGYDPRTGDVSRITHVTNHPSGTAIDINESDEGEHDSRQSLYDWWAKGKLSSDAGWAYKTNPPADAARRIKSKYQIVDWFGPNALGGDIGNPSYFDYMHWQLSQNRRITQDDVNRVMRQLSISTAGIQGIYTPLSSYLPAAGGGGGSISSTPTYAPPTWKDISDAGKKIILSSLSFWGGGPKQDINNKIVGKAKLISGGNLSSTTGLPPTSTSTPTGNRALGQQLAAKYGWGSGSEWNALDFIWQHESGWSTTSWDSAQGNQMDPVDPRAHLTWGIPQANPAHKMASAGSDWVTNPATQIAWGLKYIKDSYGDPVNTYNKGMARGHSGVNDGWGWYADGGHILGPGGPKEDRIPAMLSNGEYVVKADSVKKYGVGFMDSINKGHYANGGKVSKFATGGGSSSSNSSGSGESWLKQFIMSHGVSDAVAHILWAIGMRESGGDPKNISGQDYGIWQINDSHLGDIRKMFGSNATMQDMLNPENNFKYMKSISKNFTDWTPWGLAADGKNFDWSQYPQSWQDKYRANSEKEYLSWYNKYSPSSASTSASSASATKPEEIPPPTETDVEYWQHPRSMTKAQIAAANRAARNAKTKIAKEKAHLAHLAHLKHMKHKHADGGKIFGEGGSMDDKIPAMLSNGEFVVRAAAVSKYGSQMLDAINNGTFDYKVSKPMARGGMIGPRSNDSSSSVNNNVEYNINVNVEGSNATPEQIANVVIKTIKQKERANNTYRNIG